MDEYIIKQYLGLLLIGTLLTQASLSIDKCTFEDGFCKWENDRKDTFNWTRTRGDSRLDNIHLPTDRTGKDGYFIAIANNGSGYAKNAKLTSPHYSQGHACFELWCILTRGTKNFIRIDVWKTEKRVKESVFTLKNIENGTWMQAFFNLNPSTAFTIEISGSLGKDSVGYLAVDDTTVTADKLCSADCNFEYGFCAWEQQGNNEDDFNWLRRSGRTSGDNTGPIGDHTSGDGYYIYAASNVRSDTRKARLSVEVESGEHCLIFWFYMYGADVESLHVYVTTYADGELSVYSVHGDKGKKWIEAQIDIKEAAHQITLEGVTGSGKLGHIAVDDITMRSGVCKPDENAASLTAVYVLVPVIILILIVISVALIVWRKRRAKGQTSSDVPRETWAETKNNSITNKTYTGHVLEKQNNQANSKENETISDDSEYAVITDDNIQRYNSNSVKNNSINTSLKTKQDRDYGYDRLKKSSTPFVDKTYCHIFEQNKDIRNGNDDGSKSTIENEGQQTKTKMSNNDKRNSSCNTTPNKTRFPFEIEDDHDVDYDHAEAGGLDPASKPDNYSHLHSADASTCSTADMLDDRPNKAEGNPIENDKEDKCYSIVGKEGNNDDLPETQISCFHDYFILEKKQ